MAAAKATFALNAAPNTRRFPAIILLLKGCLPPGKLHLIRAPEIRGPPQSFVELGDETEKIGFVWQPIVKIGAKVGDTWESEEQHGVVHKYKLEEFGETGLTEPRRTSVSITDHMTLNGEPVLITEWTLAKGLGVVGKTVIVGASRSIMELWGKGLGTKSLTEAERKFFQ